MISAMASLHGYQERNHGYYESTDPYINFNDNCLDSTGKLKFIGGSGTAPCYVSPLHSPVPVGEQAYPPTLPQQIVETDPISDPSLEPFFDSVSTSLPPQPEFGEGVTVLEHVNQGALVSNLQSTRLLVFDGLTADDVSVKKATDLSRRYPTSLAFGYFELLLNSRDMALVTNEHTRMVGYNSLLQEVGFGNIGYQLFADNTFAIFRQLILVLPKNNPFEDGSLLDSFNDVKISDSIITHFKLLTSAWVRTNAVFYQQFLHEPVESYCESKIEPFESEPEFLALHALIDCIFKPAGFAVNFLELGTEEGTMGGLLSNPTMHLSTILDPLNVLLRPATITSPSRCDILYKGQNLELSPSPANIPLPLSPISSHGSPISQVRMNLSQQGLPEEYFPNTSSVMETSMPYSPRLSFTNPPDIHATAIPTNFRPSMFQFQSATVPVVHFQTATFKNSPYNPSHFQSENFQPEMYNPETDDKH